MYIKCEPHLRMGRTKVLCYVIQILICLIVLMELIDAFKTKSSNTIVYHKKNKSFNQYDDNHHYTNDHIHHLKKSKKVQEPFEYYRDDNMKYQQQELSNNNGNRKGQRQRYNKHGNLLLPF